MMYKRKIDSKSFLNANLNNVLESKDEKDSKDIDFKDLDSKSKADSTKQLRNTPLAKI